MTFFIHSYQSAVQFGNISLLAWKIFHLTYYSIRSSDKELSQFMFIWKHLYVNFILKFTVAGYKILSRHFFTKYPKEVITLYSKYYCFWREVNLILVPLYILSFFLWLLLRLYFFKICLSTIWLWCTSLSFSLHLPRFECDELLESVSWYLSSILEKCQPFSLFSLKY